MAKEMKTPDLTYLALKVESSFQEFFKGYIELLQKKFKEIEVRGNNYSYTYRTCGQIHDPHNPEWRPFQHLWGYCERTLYDFFEVRDLIEKRIGHKVVCECEWIGDNRERRRNELTRVFGVDFGEPGKREVDVV